MKEQYLIKWRNRSEYPGPCTVGVSRFSSVEKAQFQADIWKRVFPFNTYYTEPAR